MGFGPNRTIERVRGQLTNLKLDEHQTKYCNLYEIPANLLLFACLQQIQPLTSHAYGPYGYSCKSYSVAESRRPWGPTQ